MTVFGGTGRRGLDTAWERRALWTAGIFAISTFLVAALVGVALLPGGISPWAPVVVAALLACVVYLGMTRRFRHRRAILSQPFPSDWEAVLQHEVAFYRALEPTERERFRRELQVFLGEKRITGIKTDVDTTTRVLAAASAIIPIFGFPDWEWDQISEILVYPARFDKEFDFGAGPGRHTLGMVGSGAMNRLMILSKPDLLRGFRNPGDKRNVGIHEFAHLVDKSDGTIDGVPGIDRRAVGPWFELMRRKMDEIRRGDSDIDPYALTSPAEFFAVAAEYFFERPGVMERKHPELYAMLAEVFNQDLRTRAKKLAREIKRGRPAFGRNSPCPCGSREKFKKCCRKTSGTRP